MSVTFRKLHPSIGAEVSPIDLRQVRDRETLERLRAGMDQHAVLVFRSQAFTDAEQMAFAQRFDGELHAKTGISALSKNRLGNEAVADISNVDEKGEIRAVGDRRRMYSLSNRLWHTDGSFQDPPGRYSTLSARVVPPVRADTEFADMRAAYDALDADMKAHIEGLRAHHSIAHSRQLIGFEFSAEELDKLKGAVHPLARVNPRTNRHSLYIASHATRIVDYPLPEGRLLLLDLMEHATQRQFVYAHEWRDGDFMIWDNLATMHRARPSTIPGIAARTAASTLDVPLPVTA
ncbi:MAG: TauD/TfdA family dioxygenase [Burkholderiales bacterium]|nr:TauD/TfdA family dioxygenase [Burkholderiales bacterium]